MRSKRGQNTSEYLLLLTLGVISSISLLTVFGGQINAKIAYVSAVIAGDVRAVENASGAERVITKDAALRVQQRKFKVAGIDVDELKYGMGRE